MNSFRTELLPTTEKRKIDHRSRIVTIGSCFSDSIGNKLADNKFDALINPFGTVYNPISIHRLLTHSIEATSPAGDTYLHHQGLYYNYQFHSKFFSLHQEELAKQIRTVVDQSHKFLEESNVLIVTYGTAYIFQRIDNGEVVANCHKVPGTNFTRRLLGTEEIIENFHALRKVIQTRVKLDKIILTVSPVRHLKNTLELNNLSKSILRVACHHLADQYPDVDYFPSYEIMMDDLRDYRFYKSDMIHPTELAEDYIWEKFSDVYFAQSIKDFLREWGEIKRSLQHRPMMANSTSHRAFLKKTISRLEELKPGIDVEKELLILKSQL